jgi:hypothetical protein
MGTMGTLFTREEFATWCQTPIAADDAYATAVMDAVTALIVDVAKAPDWELDPSTAPRVVKLIALRVARRTYLNPDQEVTSSVGPISSSILREAASGMMLTESELEQILAVAPDGDPSNGLWVQRTTRGPLTPADELVFLPTASGDMIPYAYEGETSAFDAPAEGEPTTDPGAGYVDPALFAALQSQVESMQAVLAAKADAAAVAPKADKSYVDAGLATKASTADVTLALAQKADATATVTALSGKADQADVDALSQEVAGKAEQSDLTAGLAVKANITDVNAALAGKVDTADFDDLFGEVSALESTVAGKAEAADLGPQIQLGDTPPESGSGKLWADTTPED